MKNTELSFLFIFGTLLVCTDADVPRVCDGGIVDRYVGKPRLNDSLDLSKVKQYWITQKLDHFYTNDGRTWRERYYVNEKFFNKKKQGPLFVNFGGEDEADGSWCYGGGWLPYADYFGALLLCTEHRYYGKSKPTPNLKTENLKYLSSEQALEDFAVLIKEIKSKYSISKAIVFGGSYAGAMAAWFRDKYPDVADGAVSVSGPILAKFDFFEYLDVVDQSLKTYDGTNDCDDAIHNATETMAQLMKTSSGRSRLKDIFSLCESINVNKPKDIANLYLTLALPIMSGVQYNLANAVFKFKGRQYEFGDSIHFYCQVMTDPDNGTPIERYAQILKGSDCDCTEFSYKSFIQNYKYTAWDSDAMDRQWLYQKCTEFGFFKTTDSTKQPFGDGITLPFHVDWCMDVFGSQFNKTFVSNAVKSTNEHYGGLDIKLTKAVFFNGGIDPWHALGIITPTHKKDVHTFFVKGVSHCAFMNDPDSSDPQALREAREKTREIIKGWLQQ